MCIRLTASQDGPLTARWTLQSPRIVLRLRSDSRGHRPSCAASSEEGASRPPYPSSVTERRHRVYRRRGSGPSPGLHRALCRVLRSPPAHRCAVAHRSLASAETYSRTLALVGVTTTRSSPLGFPSRVSPMCCPLPQRHPKVALLRRGDSSFLARSAPVDSHHLGGLLRETHTPKSAGPKLMSFADGIRGCLPSPTSPATEPKLDASSTVEHIVSGLLHPDFPHGVHCISLRSSARGDPKDSRHTAGCWDDLLGHRLG